MKTWQEHIEAAEEALANAVKATTPEGVYGARDIATTHLDIAQFIHATE
jgi:hypothetical protein